jgi:predicted nucleic acid-binding protein
MSAEIAIGGGQEKSKLNPRIFVLNGSIALEWFFEDKADDYAEAVEDSLISAPALVLSLWPLEIANGALVGERRKRTTEAKVMRFLSLLKSLPIMGDDETAARAWQATMQLARGRITFRPMTRLTWSWRCGKTCRWSRSTMT